MKFFASLLIALTTGIALTTAVAKDCHKGGSGPKLFCYYGNVPAEDAVIRDACRCSHLVLPHDVDADAVHSIRSKLESTTKILITVHDLNEGLVRTLKKTKVDGLEVKLKKLRSREDIADFLSTVRTKLDKDLFVALSVPAKPEILAKYYDFKALSKSADVFLLETSFLGTSKNVTFHPSRLSGLWDVQNTDSVVDLVSGLGAPLSKLVVAAPVQAFKFALQTERHTAPGSPALELSTISRDELCRAMGAGEGWMLERDQDQAGPYIFREKEWIAFEDSMSMDIKAKYARVRGLAGLALKDVSQDGGSSCGGSLLAAAAEGLSRQARAPRGALLQSLEREILETPTKKSKNVQLSPYRISRVIDVEGKVHVIRQDTRTEFECSRQGYFVHPRSCGRFYRCVKFDQLTEEFSVFEFDCPAGLAFDERVEVCVWPGSLPHASACSGSSEIAPVPKQRFVCPSEPGYYADPENCRWFFACLDHGTSPLTAYEFRCPYGLVFDGERLLCEWPWLAPKCASGLAFAEGYESRAVGDYSLDLYDGLGSLKGIRLGGLSGPLQQPISKSYSSFGKGNYQNLLLGIANANTDHSGNLELLSGEAVVNGASKSGSYSRFSSSGGRNSGGSYNKFSSANAGAQSSTGYSSGIVHKSSSNAGKYNKISSGSQVSGGYSAGVVHGEGLNIATGIAQEEGSNSASGNYNKFSSGSISEGEGGYSAGIAHGEALNIVSGLNAASGSYSKFSSANAGAQSSSGYSSGIVHKSGSNAGNYNKFSFGTKSGSQVSSGYSSGITQGEGLNIASGVVHEANSNSASGNYNKFSFGTKSGSQVSSGYSSGITQSEGLNIASGVVHEANSNSASGNYNKYSSGSISGGESSYSAGITHGEGLNIAAGLNAASGNYNKFSSGASSISGSSASQATGSYSSGIGHGEGLNIATGIVHEAGSDFASGNYNKFSSGASSISGSSASQATGSYTSGIGHGEGLNIATGIVHEAGSDSASGNYNKFSSGSISGHQGIAHGGALNIASGSVHQSSLNGASGNYKKFSSGSKASGSFSSSGVGSNVAGGNAHIYNKFSFGTNVNSGNSGSQVSAGITHGQGLIVESGNAESYRELSSANSGSQASGGYSTGIVHGESLNLASGIADDHVYSHGDELNVATGNSYSSFASGANSNAGSFSAGVVHGEGLNSAAGNAGSYSKFSFGTGSLSGNSQSHVSNGYTSGVIHGEGLNVAAGNVESYDKLSSGSLTISDNSGIAHGEGLILENEGIVHGGNAESYSKFSSGSSSIAGTHVAAGIDHEANLNLATGLLLGEEEKLNVATGGNYNKFSSGSSVHSGSHVTHGISSAIVDAESLNLGLGNAESYSKFSSGSSSNSGSQIAGGYAAGVAHGDGLLDHTDYGNQAQTILLNQETINSGSPVYSQNTDFVAGAVGGQESSLNLASGHSSGFSSGIVHGQSSSSQAEAVNLAFSSDNSDGHVDIVGGGFSGVGNVKVFENEQPIVATVATAIPTVTAVPIPAQKEFETFSAGGVVANLPDLQLKLENPSTINDHLTAKSPAVTLTNVLLASTPSTVGYDYPKPKIPFIEGSTAKPTYLPPVQETYLPSVQKTYLPSVQKSYVRPLRPVGGLKATVIENYNKPAVVTTYHHEKPAVVQQHVNIHEVKPSISVQEVKIVKPAVVQTYHQKPAVIQQQTAHVTPTVTYENVKIEKPVKFEGYTYDKPSIVFEEKPQIKIEKPAVVQTYFHQKPAVIKQQTVHIEPTVTYESVKTEKPVKFEGYKYEKPQIRTEKPAVVQTYFHQKPAVIRQQTVTYKRPAVIQQQTVEVKTPVKVEGYHYEKPTIKFEIPKPTVSYQQEVKVQKPAVVHTYYHQKPAVVHQQIVHEVQPTVEIKQQTVEINKGYHYEKPAIKFEEVPKPVVTYEQEIKVQKPAVVQTYYHQKPAVVHQKIVHEVQPKVEIKQQTIEVNEGYNYEKPAIKFEEVPKPVVTYQQENKVQKPAVVQSYYHQKPAVVHQKIVHEVQPKVEINKQQTIEVNEGYHYGKPTIKFEETLKPVVTYHKEVKVQKPAVVQTYFHQKPAVVHQQTVKVDEGYHYEKPTIKFEETPKPVVTYHHQEVKVQQKPTVQTYYHQKPTVKPIVSYEQVKPEVKFEGYHYEKPAVKFEIPKPAVTYHQEVKVKKPAVVVESYYQQQKPVVVIQHQTQRPTVVYEKPAVTYQEVKIAKPVETYHYQKPDVVKIEEPVKFEGYKYEKPTIAFEEKRKVVKIEQPAVVQTYFHQKQVNPTEKPAVFEQKTVEINKFEGYKYEKPTIQFEEKPVVSYQQEVKVQKPAFVHSYYHQKPAVVQTPTVTYESVKVEQPVRVVQRVQQHRQRVQIKKQEGYRYEKPAIVFEEKPQVIVEQQKPAVVQTYFHQKQPVVLEQKTIVQVNPVTAKPVVVENYVYKDEGYHYDKPAIAFEERPTYKEVVTQTVRPTTPRIVPQVSTYTYHHRRPSYVSSTTTERVPVVEEIIIPKKAYVTGGEAGYNYPKPEIKFDLPKPTVVAEIENAPLKEFRYYDSRYQNVVSSTAAPISSSTYRIRTRRPTLKRVYLPVSTTERVVALTREYLPVVKEYLPVTTAKISKEYLPVTRRPSKQYLPVTKTYVPVTRRPSKEYLPATTTKISREYIPVTRRPSKQYLPVTEISKEYIPITKARRPSKEYLPVTTEPSKEYLPVTTARRPSKEYLPVTTARRPSKEYLPVTTPKQYVSVTTPEYVSVVSTEEPFVTTAKISKEYLPVTTSRRPSKEYLPATKKPSREYLPVTKETIPVTTLRPSTEYLPVTQGGGIQVENYENKEYQISSTEKPSLEYLPVETSSTTKPQKSKAIIKVNDFHPILAAKLGAQCTCVSNTVKLRKRPSTRIQDLEEYVVQDQSVHDDGDDNGEEDEVVFVRKSTTPSSRVSKKSRRPSVTIVNEEDDESASIKEEIKSAVREGVKAGVKEALASTDFDRYGPGGLRGRTETLQGTVDCQRAGLFRHPKHCNKFYTCRWDESKKKFTLHVFNCPVHLTFDNNLGACNWPSQGPACVDNTLLPSE